MTTGRTPQNFEVRCELAEIVLMPNYFHPEAGTIISPNPPWNPSHGGTILPRNFSDCESYAAGNFCSGLRFTAGWSWFGVAFCTTNPVYFRTLIHV